jgi:hypothetical protein
MHEVMDQPRQALNFYMIAAHMSGKVSKWKVCRCKMVHSVASRARRSTST